MLSNDNTAHRGSTEGLLGHDPRTCQFHRQACCTEYNVGNNLPASPSEAAVIRLGGSPGVGWMDLS